MLVWESTTLSTIKDIDTNSHRKGVQVVPLSRRVEEYSGEIAIRVLIPQLSDDQSEELRETRKEFKGRPYEKDKWELICSCYDGPGGRNTLDLQSLFCSELVAEVYQRIGLLDKSNPSNEYTPANFAKGYDDFLAPAEDLVFDLVNCIVPDFFNNRRITTLTIPSVFNFG